MEKDLRKEIKICDECGELDFIRENEILCKSCKKKLQDKNKKLLEI